jgi:hypothetical protein
MLRIAMLIALGAFAFGLGLKCTFHCSKLIQL